MFQVAHTHCILATKFARSFLKMMCILKKSLNPIFESVSDLLAKQISKRAGSTYNLFLFVFLLIVDKEIAHC